MGPASPCGIPCSREQTPIQPLMTVRTILIALEGKQALLEQSTQEACGEQPSHVWDIRF